MRILIVHNTLNDSKSMNGVLRHYAWMAEEWNRGDNQTDFLMAKVGFPQMRELAPSARLFSSDNIFDATNHIQETWRYFPAYALRMLSVHTLQFPEPYDVIYASAQPIFEMYPAMLLSKKLDCALAVKIHHVITTQAKRRGLIDQLFAWSERVTARWINRHAELIICNTPLVANDFAHLEKSLGLKPAEKTNLGCGVEYERLAGHRRSDKRYDAVILARMHEQKGVFDIAPFWKSVMVRHPKAKLLVIGEGAHRPRAEQIVREHGLQDSVTFTGGIPESQKNELIGLAKIGVSLSYEEGWGMAINEFLAVGIPVVAYDLPVFRYAFPGQLLLVKAGDPQAAGTEVAKLLGDENKREQIGQRGSEFVRQYDFTELAKRELAALAIAVEKHRGKSAGR